MGTKCSQQDVWDGKSQRWARTCSQGWATSTSQGQALTQPQGFWGAMGCGWRSAPMLRAIVSWGPRSLSFPRGSGVSPHHPGGRSGRARSPPCWRQQLAWTLFWMFMGFQFTPGSEAAKLPSQGGVIPRGRPAAWPPVEGGPALGPLSSWCVRGSLPAPKNLEQIKY